MTERLDWETINKGHYTMTVDADLHDQRTKTWREGTRTFHVIRAEDGRWRVFYSNSIYPGPISFTSQLFDSSKAARLYAETSNERIQRTSARLRAVAAELLAKDVAELLAKE